MGITWLHHKRWISSSTFLNSSLKLILAFEFKKLSPKMHFFSDLSPFCTTLILTFLPSLFSMSDQSNAYFSGFRTFSLLSHTTLTSQKTTSTSTRDDPLFKFVLSHFKKFYTLIKK